MRFDQHDARRFAARCGPRQLAADDLPMVVEAMESISLAGRSVTRVVSKFEMPASVFAVPAADAGDATLPQ